MKRTTEEFQEKEVTLSRGREFLQYKKRVMWMEWLLSSQDATSTDLSGEEDMHGLIFVTWEKYLSERFGSLLLTAYRQTIGETATSAPLACRVYDDATLLAGVGVASQLTKWPADVLLREYGHYFILNSLTSHLCAYLLTKVHSGRELLLVMRHAHQQMSCTPDGLTPPLFGYEALPDDPHGLVLIYESPRKMCPVLMGAIEGAADRYGERVHIVEQACMKQGAPACRFEVHFSASLSRSRSGLETPEQRVRRRAQQQLADLVLSVLPYEDGVTLGTLQWLLQQRTTSQQELRPFIVLKTLYHLQFVGLVACTANQPDDRLIHRRYWRTPALDKEETEEMRRDWPSRQLLVP